jgi:hypothetical protein
MLSGNPAEAPVPKSIRNLKTITMKSTPKSHTLRTPASRYLISSLGFFLSLLTVLFLLMILNAAVLP